jgi:hypothetical protein
MVAPMQVTNTANGGSILIPQMFLAPFIGVGVGIGIEIDSATHSARRKRTRCRFR